MNDRTAVSPRLALVASLVVLAAGLAPGRDNPKEPDFKYEGGTERITQECGGQLEVTENSLNFRCPEAAVQIPFAALSLMQYRPDVSREVRRMRPKWKVYPRSGSSATNQYFTVVYGEGGQTHVVVLKVKPLAMRPYLAEIELKTGKRIEVKGYEKNDD